MEKWLTWLIPLIAIAVWILSQLAGNQQQKRPTSRPFPPRDPEQDPSARRTPDDLQEFLEKMQRRKDAEEKAAAARTAAEPVLMAEEVVQPRPVPRTAPPPLPRPVEQRRKSTPIGSQKPQRRPEPVILAEPLSSVPAELNRTVSMPSMTPVVPQAPQALPAAAAAPTAPQAIHRPEALPTKAWLPPVAKMVRELLKSRQTLAAAILLREVLDPPLCKRARRASPPPQPAGSPQA